MTYHTALDALGDRTRREIVEVLAAGPSSVGQIAERLPVSRPAVSQHVKVLVAAGLLETKAAGNRTVCQLRRQGFAEIRNYVDRLWDLPLQRYAEAARRSAASRGDEQSEEE